MLMGVLRPWGGAALAIHPTRVAVLVVLLLPDGHAVFHFVNDIAAGAKGLIAVAGRDAHPYRHLADGEIADAMHARSVLDTEALMASATMRSPSFTASGWN